VIYVAIAQSGPIQDNMAHPYLMRRNGEESVVYLSKDHEDILGRTLGVPLFQEQAMEIAILPKVLHLLKRVSCAGVWLL
jgi:error-prone DNA polymerase